MKSYTSISDMKKTLIDESAGSSGGGGKRFLFLRDGDNFKIRFRQEIAEDGQNYDDQRGTALVVPVVTSPINWKFKAMSTASMEETNYRCWAVEQMQQDYKWRPKPHLLVNVAVETEPGIWESRLIETTLTNSRHVGQTIIEYAETYGTITDRYYKYSRVGSGAQDTSYQLIPLETTEEPEVISVLQMHDLSKVYKIIPYDQQESFYTTGETSDSGGAW